MRGALVTFLRQYYGIYRVLANISGVCQLQTQSNHKPHNSVIFLHQSAGLFGEHAERRDSDPAAIFGVDSAFF